jgi:hypothetical protein
MLRLELPEARFDVRLTISRTFDSNRRDNDASLLELIQQPVDQAAWIQQPCTGAPYVPRCLDDHQPSSSMT